MVVVKYVYVSFVLRPFRGIGDARKNCGIISVGGFCNAHSCGR